MQDVATLLNQHVTLTVTVVFVTHSIDEAITLATRVIIMRRNPGRPEREIVVPIDGPRSVASVRRQPCPRRAR